MRFEVYTFFLTPFTAQFHWTKIIQVIACQYGQTDKQVNAMNWSTKVNYLKRNPVTVVRQIDYVFEQLCGKIILSEMHSIGHVLSFHDWREFQNRGIEHMHALIHIVDVPKIDGKENSEVAELINKYIICALPGETKYPTHRPLTTYLPTHRPFTNQHTDRLSWIYVKT